MLTDTKIAAIKPPASGQREYPDHKVTGLRLRVGSGGKKTWTLRRRLGAKVINRKVGTYPQMKLAAARDKAEGMIEALEASGSTEGLDRTFGQVAEHWLETVAKPKNRNAPEQERQLELHVLPHWRDRKITTIKRADARDLFDGLEGKVLPNRILALVRTIFRHALRRDWLEASPIEGIEKPKAERPRDRVLDMPEIAAVWRAGALLGYPMGPWLQTLLLTAQRRAEVAGMRWTDLDLEAGTWTLTADSTKASRAHLVPLSPAVIAIIKAQPQLGDYVFTTTGETPISGFAKAKTRLDKYLASRGEELKPWRFHDLRRTAATHMVRLGIAETTVSRVLNHALQGVTAQVYALHSYAPEKRHALDAWASEVERALGIATGDNVVQING
ncbi:tyrosine-type recombinase/integrase [Aurantiacibacter sp. MUD61]|uniref:tyrosine-type recombinase/integrase n=1 Tax=Aurantiacibacter sp. MUD61 TaxID=3009083 RepID=UPI0022F110D5|nr:site-specific integrase [Aurantiacibacter sp. MUD61]